MLSARTSTVVWSLGLSQSSTTIKIVPDSNPHVKINSAISTSSTTFIQFKINLFSFMCGLFNSLFVRISACANVYFKTTIINQNIKIIP